MDDYKEKLKKYIAEIPAIPYEITSGQKCAPADFMKLKTAKMNKDSAAGRAVFAELQGKYKTNDLFMKYIGTSHFSLLDNWAGGGQLTTCNGFAGNCGRAMGAKDFLGQFELEAFLQKIGKRHAWVSAVSGKKPGYGDIFRAESFHMGVSLGLNDGGKWLTVEAGQGGPNSTGYDAIKRKQQNFNPGSIKGWCDMRLYFDPRPPVPDWLVGLWTIYCGGETHTYRFTEYSEAFYYPWKPTDNSESDRWTDTGTVTLHGSDSFIVNWTREGVIEKFKYDRDGSFPGIREQMTGTNNQGESLTGIRL